MNRQIIRSTSIVLAGLCALSGLFSCDRSDAEKAGNNVQAAAEKTGNAVSKGIDKAGFAANTAINAVNDAGRTAVARTRDATTQPRAGLDKAAVQSREPRGSRRPTSPFIGTVT